MGSADSMLSFNSTGMPCKGPRGPLVCSSLSSSRACLSASGLMAMMDRSCGPLRSMASIRRVKAWTSSTDVVLRESRSARSSLKVRVSGSSAAFTVPAATESAAIMPNERRSDAFKLPFIDSIIGFQQRLVSAMAGRYIQPASGHKRLEARTDKHVAPPAKRPQEQPVCSGALPFERRVDPHENNEPGRRDGRDRPLRQRRVGGRRSSPTCRSDIQGLGAHRWPGLRRRGQPDGNIVLERGYGMADLEQGVAIRPDTVFNIASLSKQFTAVSLLLLQEQGKLSLDDDIRKYLSEVPDYGKRITLRHLANHTSGLRDLPSVLALAGWNWLDAVPEAYALDVIARQKHLNFEPGSKYSYSNSGYYLMAVVVERVSGQRFSEFTRDHIFQPLGMLHSRFYDDRRMIMKSRAIGHMKLPGGGFGVWRPTYEIVGDGALLTTVQDMALWDRNFLNPKLGRNPQQLLADMTKVGVLNDGKPLDYALGAWRSRTIAACPPSVTAAVCRATTPSCCVSRNRSSRPRFCAISAAARRERPRRRIADIYLDGKFPEGPETPKPREQPDVPPPAQRQPVGR